jgi:hypothetical protein
MEYLTILGADEPLTLMLEEFDQEWTRKLAAKQTNYNEGDGEGGMNVRL